MYRYIKADKNNTEDPDDLYRIARNEHTRANALDMLADYDVGDEELNVEIRIAILRNPNVSEATLDKLSHDQNFEVREYVAKCPKVPGYLMERLVDDPDNRVRAQVAKFTDSLALLEKLQNDPSHWVRSNVIRNKHVTVAILKGVMSASKDDPHLVQAARSKAMDIIGESI